MPEVAELPGTATRNSETRRTAGTAGTSGTAGTAPMRRPRWQAGAAVALTLAVLAPIFAVVLQRWGHPYLPVQDQAVFDLRIRDVWSFSANTPLAGPYSRFGWDHPGPTVFYVLAAFSGIFGEAAWASLVGNALIQGVAIVWLARLAWKAGGLRWVVPWLAIVALSYKATGPWILQELWNPHVAFPFFALFLLQCTVVARGDAKRLAGLAFVASFLVQTHVGYALLVAIPTIWALWRLAGHLGANGQRLGSRSVLQAPVIVVAVVWFVPVVLDPIFHFPGNLARLTKFYLGLDQHSNQALLGVHNALGYMAAEFRWLPPWLGGADRLDSLTGLATPASIAWLVIPAVLVVTALALARRCDDGDLRVLAEMTAVVLATGLVTLALLRGAPDPYLFYWRIVIGAATIVLSLFVIIEALDTVRKRPAAGSYLAALIVAVGLSTSSFTSAVAAARGPISPMAPIASSILAQLDSEHQPAGKILMRFWGSPLGGLQGALADQLLRQGDGVFFDSAVGHQFGYGREATPSTVGSVWYVTEESQLYSLMSRLPGARVLAVSHPLTSGRLAAFVTLQRTIAGELDADGKPDLVAYLGNPFVWAFIPKLPNIARGQVNALAKLDAEVQSHDGCLCSVIAFPPDRVPADLPATAP